jgi:hypothetical protein
MPLLKAKVAPEVVQTITTSTPTPEQLGQVAAVKTAVKKAAASETMSKADWHDKDVRISRQGLFQACLQSVGLLQLNTGNTLEDYLKLVEQAADRGLEYVNRK